MLWFTIGVLILVAIAVYILFDCGKKDTYNSGYDSWID